MSDPLGSEIRELRKRLGVNQKQFAEIMDVNKGTIYFWEKGTHRPSVKNADKIAELASNLSEYKRLLNS